MFDQWIKFKCLERNVNNCLHTHDCPDVSTTSALEIGSTKKNISREKYQTNKLAGKTVSYFLLHEVQL